MSVSDSSYSWRTDRSKVSSYDVTRPPSTSKLRKPANGIYPSQISGMKFPAWREPKIKRSNSAASSTSSERYFPKQGIPASMRRSLDVRGEQNVKDIVERLSSSPTVATNMKLIRLHPNTVLLNMNHYSWSNMAVYKDVQKTLYSKHGNMKKPTAMSSRR